MTRCGIGRVIGSDGLDQGTEKVLDTMYLERSSHNDHHLWLASLGRIDVLDLDVTDLFRVGMRFVVQHKAWTKGTDLNSSS